MSINPKDNEIIATCSLTNIVRGPFQACNIGYAIPEQYQSKGLMKKLCSYVIHHSFDELGLNRIIANYMPSNQRSEVLLNRLGFSKEGIAKKYLRINGKWEDHVFTSLLNPKNT
ncbi:MAG: GNAT family N-acetyltransferase [Candidatus Reddybacter sp.]